MLPLWNAYGFFASYANIDGFTTEMLASAPAKADRPRIDRWILASLADTEEKIHATMEKYEIAPVFGHLNKFIDNLTNWYIRLGRSRFWEEKGNSFSADKLSAYATLWESLEAFSRLLAPFLPFFSECLYTSLHEAVAPGDLAAKNAKSVHEDLFDLHRKISKEEEPLLNLHLSQADIEKMAASSLDNRDRELLAEMAIAQKVILLGRSLRAEAKIGLRQPLTRLSLAAVTEEEKRYLSELGDLVTRELNLKSIDFLTDPRELVEVSLKPNLPKLGPRLGKKMGEVTGKLRAWTAQEIAQFEKNGFAIVSGERLDRDDLLIERKAKPGKCAAALEGIVGELDVKLSPELIEEGLGREIINRIQQRRKAMGLKLTDRILVKFQAEGSAKPILERESQTPGYLSGEVLAVGWKASQLEAPEFESIETGGEITKIAFELALAERP
jgi:isoleucyl-tRNA synthetase